MEGRVADIGWCLARLPLFVAVPGLQRHRFRIYLDHGAVGVAADRHERVGDTTRKRMAFPIHQFGQHISHVLWVARRNRYVVDHRCQTPLYWTVAAGGVFTPDHPTMHADHDKVLHWPG